MTAAGDGTATGPDPLQYSVEVERGVRIDVKEFASSVASTLTHPQGWRAVGEHEFQRVDKDPQVRVVLASPATVDRLCAPLETRGELSCRNGGLVVINALRWVFGAAGYRDAIADYRRYVVNHEVGHALGYRHETCPAAGAPAPIMLQQTIGLDGCTPNPWPSAAPP